MDAPALWARTHENWMQISDLLRFSLMNQVSLYVS